MIRVTSAEPGKDFAWEHLLPAWRGAEVFYVRRWQNFLRCWGELGFVFTCVKGNPGHFRPASTRGRGAEAPLSNLFHPLCP